MDFINFIYNLKAIRTSSGLTASELSKQCGFKQVKRISDFECGRCKPLLDEVNTICEVLGVTMDQMLKQKVIVKYEWE